jgi:NAD-dependent dihydropyrimidine dehydrogenase PreA subunit
MFNSYKQNTLKYDEEECINCGMCSKVCPHGVFVRGKKSAVLANKEACMECGACLLNCPTTAIEVESGVGCAAAMIQAALTGGEETCDNCCGETDGTHESATCECKEK